MVRVCVVGGGAAGLAAAAEAAVSGAGVTLIEKDEEVPAGQRGWFGLLDPSGPGTEKASPNIPPGIELRVGELVSSIDSNCTVVTSRGRAKFDSTVVATGCAPVVPSAAGLRKRGVIVLESASARESLMEQIGTSEETVVAGHGLSVLRVADRLSRTGKHLTVIATGLRSSFEMGGALPAISYAANARGVSILDSQLQRALGLDALEAVLAGTVVFPCDLLVVVPRMVPCLPKVEAAVGSGGGFVVDPRMRSSSSDIFAAGGCAEFASNPRFQVSDSLTVAMAMGRVAGANASGRGVRFNPVRSVDVEVFGLRFASAGLTVQEARLAGLPVSVVSKRLGPTSECSVVYGSRDSRILGIQFVGEARTPSIDLTLAVSQRVSLNDMAYSETGGSTDISFVSETAREGLRRA